MVLRAVRLKICVPQEPPQCRPARSAYSGAADVTPGTEQPQTVAFDPNPTTDRIEIPERSAKRIHAVATVAGMHGADPLPTIRWRADGSIGANRGRIGVHGKIAALVHGVELREDLRPLAS